MTEIREQLLEMLKAVATALGDDLRNRLVFVGGCTTALFITDPVTLEDVRSTDDIDLIVEHHHIDAASTRPRCRTDDQAGRRIPVEHAVFGLSDPWRDNGVVLHLTVRFCRE
ncbi:hypothetical protein [Pararhizobium sp. PWRC1-1]|uniref:hypothetical protein n=1 Tax=Pararhizobium sp. PWRC1-1 TaxID=2804566 RepID=UPI003CF22B70